MTALHEELLLRTGWLLAATAVVLGFAQQVRPGLFG
jgi:hypothetical protein